MLLEPPRGLVKVSLPFALLSILLIENFLTAFPLPESIEGVIVIAYSKAPVWEKKLEVSKAEADGVVSSPSFPLLSNFIGPFLGIKDF